MYTLGDSSFLPRPVRITYCILWHCNKKDACRASAGCGLFLWSVEEYRTALGKPQPSARTKEEREREREREGEKSTVVAAFLMHWLHNNDDDKQTERSRLGILRRSLGLVKEEQEEGILRTCIGSSLHTHTHTHTHTHRERERERERERRESKVIRAFSFSKPDT